MASITYRRPGVYTKEVDISTISYGEIREIRKKQIKEILREDEELLNEIVSEIRRDKINKIRTKM
jgi:hypothetical protein